jgi:hypothetical protein
MTTLQQQVTEREAHEQGRERNKDCHSEQIQERGGYHSSQLSGPAPSQERRRSGGQGERQPRGILFQMTEE